MSPETRRNRAPQMNVYPRREAPCLLLLEKVARRPDVEGTPCGIAVLKKTFRLQIPRFSFVYLPTLALVIGVPSTFPRCGGDLLQQEKAFWASLRGHTCNGVLSFDNFRAAGSRPYLGVRLVGTNSPGFFNSVSLYCPHPPLRRSPFPGGEGYGLVSGGDTFLCSARAQGGFGRLAAGHAELCKACIGISSYNLKNLLIENGGRVW